MKTRKAFTLIELLIAASILSMILASIYSAFRTGMFGYARIEDSLAADRAAGKVLERMGLDFRNAFAYSKEKSSFRGTKDEIGFLCLVDTFSGDGLTRDLALVSYSLKGGALTRLCLKNQEILNTASDIEPEEMASGIAELTFSYGYLAAPEQPLEWKEAWTDPSALPQAVQIKLTLQNKVKAEFQRTIFLPRAQ